MSTEKSKAEKIEALKVIIESLSEQHLDALLILLESRQTLKEYKFTDHELPLVAENFQRYGRKEVGGMSADESIRRLTEHLNKIRKQE